MIDPRKQPHELPPLVRDLMEGKLPENPPDWLVIDPNHPDAKRAEAERAQRKANEELDNGQ